MKILYVVLTCEAYLPTRCTWMRASWISSLPSTDEVVFLSSVAHPELNVVGWNTRDDYQGCSLKYLRFFQNTDTDADWIVFVDDDTFVFPSRLRTMLAAHSPSEALYIGKLLYGPIPTMSGGAGFALSATCYRQMCEYVRSRTIQLDHIYSDVTVGQWAMATPTVYVWDKRFNSHPHTEEGSISTALTFHYVTEPLFAYYAQYL